MNPDPQSMEELNELHEANVAITGFGTDVVLHFACPFCGATGWKDVNIFKNAVDGYSEFKRIDTCANCGRSGRIEVDQKDSSTYGRFVQTGGPPPPPWHVGIGMAKVTSG